MTPVLSDAEIDAIVAVEHKSGREEARLVEAAVLAKVDGYQNAAQLAAYCVPKEKAEKEAREREREAFACGVAAERARLPLMESGKWIEERDRRYPFPPLPASPEKPDPLAQLRADVQTIAKYLVAYIGSNDDVRRIARGES